MVALVEFVVELLGLIIREFVLLGLCAAVGFCYLHVRWRSQTIVRKILLEQYEGSYANAGLVLGLQAVATVGAILVLLLLLSLAFAAFIKHPQV